MGVYVELPNSRGKTVQLIRRGAMGIGGPPSSLREVPADKVLLCVVENGPFDAAGVVYSDSELRAFAFPGDPRPHNWLLMDRAVLLQLAPHAEPFLQ